QELRRLASGTQVETLTRPGAGLARVLFDPHGTRDPPVAPDALPVPEHHQDPQSARVAGTGRIRTCGERASDCLSRAETVVSGRPRCATRCGRWVWSQRETL